MYSVLLVDDEKIIREGIYELLSMADLDLDLTMAASAAPAIAILEERKVDIVVADICMPQMTGLELFDIIRERWAHCKVVFLTGYSEFEYVYKVHKHARYVLKAEEDWKIVEAVKESIADIENDLLLEGITEDNSIHLQYSGYYERMLLLKELVDGYTNFSRVTDETWKLLGVNLVRSKDVYSIMLRRDDTVRSGDYMEYNSASRSIGTLIEKYYMDSFQGTYFEYSRNFGYLLLQPKKLVTTARIVKLLSGISELFQKAIQKNLGEDVALFISKEPVSMKQAISDFMCIKDKMIPMAVNEIKIGSTLEDDRSEFETLSEVKKQYLTQMINELEHGFLNLDKEVIQKALDELQKGVKHVKSMHDLFVLEMYCAISSRLLGYIKKLHLGEAMAFRIGIMNLYNVSLHASWCDAFAYLKQVVDNIFELREISIENKNEDVVKKVKRYIYSHLAGDTSLYVLAEHVHLSQEYLLRVFKQKEEITILQYINDLKLKKAKELLYETDLQMKEIAEQLGFTSAGYFGRFFKSKLGITPHAYRESNCK